MKYEKINAQLFIKNRKKFTAEMLPKSIAIFNSNDIYPISADSTMPFEQNRDLFYLSGIDQEETVLILCPDAPEKTMREMLFVCQSDEHIAIWEGEKLSPEKAIEQSGIKNIYFLSDLDSVLHQVMAHCETMYLNTNEHYRANVSTETREDRFIKKIKKKYPAHRVAKSNPILQKIRSIKEPEEIELIQKACDITEKGFRRLLNFIQPNVWEYEIEAELLHEFIKNRSKGFAYAPIIASGANSNIIHYTANNQQCKAGKLILLDTGASYANYCSDLTRVVPVSGRYTKRQKQIYDAVLRVKNEATKLLTPGTLWKEFHIEVGKIMTHELLGLKLLDKADVQNENPQKPAYKKYFMHGTSHHLGLDTHDYCILTEPMEANMVFTVEPAIYLPDEKFGIRIEDDVVVKESGNPQNLMKNIPIETEEIEELMNN